MNGINPIKEKISSKGFAVVENIYSEKEIENILAGISEADSSGPAFRKSDGLFAIRRFFKEISSAIHLVFSPKLVHLINTVFGQEFFVVKSIYFDKPGKSNWFVSYHQDLTISLARKWKQRVTGPGRKNRINVQCNRLWRFFRTILPFAFTSTKQQQITAH